MSDSGTEIETGRRFAFGDNWWAFARHVDDARIGRARESLAAALGSDDLSGRTFLDVGCGSGLFSLAALRMGARVRSFDFDGTAVAAADGLRRRFAPEAAWPIEQGSVLDKEFTAGLGRFDVVYAWGVLHHTGALWDALDATCDLVRPGGLLYVSVYNDQGRASRLWWRVKRRYNRSGPLTRWTLVLGSAAYLGRRRVLNGLARRVRRGGRAGGPGARARGMSARHDLVDWVGGFPFEVATPGEVFSFVRRRGFELRFLNTCGGGLGCNEYVFERVAAGGTPRDRRLTA
ncbi:bifunctional 2-polyprenyl-6-hydroxyphenol methylase/3-demethylubiquinol 3-O-methyltransferase UbiG [Actinomadura sp. WMMA1423]|uniref:class I SAM-dependent methyltransferase n=1 Tax=Actinomadura sp. WMMA1423 TaxID=2591108 RepID=UPI00197ACFBE|nr:methyltransferase domain-containing protein [Actinomadura sp. WMMA1423]